MMCDKEVDLHYNQDAGWPTLDAVLLKKHKEIGGKFPGLRKIVVPRSESGEILSLLFQEGYSLAHLMPTLDNVVKTMVFEMKLSPLRRMRLKKLIRIKE